MRTAHKLTATWSFLGSTLLMLGPDIVISYFGVKQKRYLFRAIFVAICATAAGLLFMHTQGHFNDYSSLQSAHSLPMIQLRDSVELSTNPQSFYAETLILSVLGGLPLGLIALYAGNADLSPILTITALLLLLTIRLIIIAFLSQKLGRSRLFSRSRSRWITWSGLWVFAYIACLGFLPTF